MVRSQLHDREAFGYPPFTRLVRIVLRHTSPELVVRGARHLASRLKELIVSGVSDAHAPAVSHVADNYYMEILVRIERTTPPSDTKGLIRVALGEFSRDKLYRRIAVVINVDPQ